MEVMNKVMRDDPPPLRKENAEIPRDLETIVFKCLEKDPARRYISAHAFANDRPMGPPAGQTSAPHKSADV